MTAPTPGRPVRVALDLLGGDGAPEVVADAAALLLGHPEPLGHSEHQPPDVHLVLVGPPDLAASLLADRGLDPGDPRLSVVPAAAGVGMADDPVHAVRAHRDVSVRVAADLVASGRADATVTAGHTGAALAAGLFCLGRLRGVTRPSLAVVLPALRGPVVLLDAGAGTSATPDLLGQFALAGTAYAQALGLAAPRVGLLTIGGEPGKGDTLRRDADPLLATLPITYVGPVEGHDVALGGVADVVVTDGFTGNVALKAVEGAVAWSAERLGSAYGDAGTARRVVRDVATGDFAGGMLLGVRGVSVVGHGATTPDALAACVGLAVRAVRHDLVARTGTLLEDLVRLRRGAAGLPPAVGGVTA